MIAVWLALFGNRIVDERSGGAFGIDLHLSDDVWLLFMLCPFLVTLGCLPYVVSLHQSRQHLTFWPGFLVTIVAAIGIAAVCGWIGIVSSQIFDAGYWSTPRDSALLGSVLLAVLAMPIEILPYIVPVTMAYIGLRSFGQHVLGSTFARIACGFSVGTFTSVLERLILEAGSTPTFASWPVATLASVTLLLAFRARWAGLP